jgi:Fe-S cluster biosynthesis and repair protein YggX
MAENAERIEQFRKMADADPTNEVGHFSLGRELLAAGDPLGAAASLRRVIELNPNISKAYQLLGQALQQSGDGVGAIDVWTRGVTTADGRGELVPRDEMVTLLKGIGAPVPELTNNRVAAAAGEGEVLCKRCGKVKPRLKRVPFRNAFGQEVYDSTCNDCWQEAIRLGTKVINELRLPLADPQAQKIWDQHIREFLNLTPA